MIQYETLMLVRPDAMSDDLASLQTNIEKLIADVSGKIISYDKWGKYRLAYPVRKNNFGIYILGRFDVPEEMATGLIEELKRYFKIKAHEMVIRSLIKRLAKGTSLVYQKPQPINEGREGNVEPSTSRLASSLERKEKEHVQKQTEEKGAVQEKQERAQEKPEQDVSAEEAESAPASEEK